MKVSIAKDQWGVQLCTKKDESGRSRCLDLNEDDDLKSILLEIVKYFDKKDCNKIMFCGQKCGGLQKGDIKDHRLEWTYKYEEFDGERWIKKVGEPNYK